MKREKFMKPPNEKEPIKIEDFIKSVMALSGLKRNKDYVIYPFQLRINKHPIRGKILSLLRELYPEYTYYWETPKLLRWF